MSNRPHYWTTKTWSEINITLLFSFTKIFSSSVANLGEKVKNNNFLGVVNFSKRYANKYSWILDNLLKITEIDYGIFDVAIEIAYYVNF